MSRLLEAEAFVAVVEAGSVTAASKRIGVTTSYASKLLTRLEERLGLSLLIRTTRKVTPTEAGRVYYERSVEAIQGLEQAETMAAELLQRPTGTLRVTLPSGFGSQYVLEALADFAGLPSGRGSVSTSMTPWPTARRPRSSAWRTPAASPSSSPSTRRRAPNKGKGTKAALDAADYEGGYEG